MDFKKIIAEKLSQIISLDIKEIEEGVEIPPKSDMGDYSFPCFKLAKVLRKPPMLIAQDIANGMEDERFEKVENAGAYVNFFVSKDKFINSTISEIVEKGELYGISSVGEGKTVCVEYSSPNIAKPFHVGHLFSTAIGNSLYKIFQSQGYDVVGINHLGDWGTQFGKLISAYKRWVDKEDLEKDPISELLRIYVKFHEEAKVNPSLEDEARRYFKELEDGDKEAVELWERFRSLSLQEFKKIYSILNVDFDSYAGEGFYNDKMDVVINELGDKGILTESKGARVVMLDEYGMPPCIVLKADGATIYATRDLAAAMYRKKTYDFYKSIYVVGTPQALHFKQVFKTLELAGNEWAKDCIHVGFGLVKFADRKMATRDGEIILLEDLLEESIGATRKIIDEKNPDLQHKDDVAKKIGIGAVVFTYLKNSREKDIVFDWNEMLSFDGETGPYVQYAYARAKSILRKIDAPSGEVNYSKLKEKEEFELAKVLADFQNQISISMDKLEPSIITRYATEVAKTFNKFYNKCKVDIDDSELKLARIQLLLATTIVIRNALFLLGIDIVEEM